MEKIMEFFINLTERIWVFLKKNVREVKMTDWFTPNSEDLYTDLLQLVLFKYVVEASKLI